MIGKILAERYEITEQVGDGGMAVVYRAIDRKLNRYVAVKILRKEFADNQEFVHRFRIESQAAASLTHPNIVGIYDVGFEDNVHYIVMEYVKGKTLKKLTEEKAPLSEKEILDIAAQICAGLECAHRNHIIHRDIKPHNIIITNDGIAKITDFGIARDVNSNTMTASGNILGSVHYFSPEQAKGGHIDEKSDIYSVGVVMYEMATGRLPFDDENAISVALKHLNEEVTIPSKINYNISKQLDMIILKAMQKNPFDRYINAALMLKDLEKAKGELLGKPLVKNIPNLDNQATQVISSEEINKVLQGAKIPEKDINMEEVGDKKMGTTTKRKKMDKTTKVAIITATVLIAIISFGVYYLVKSFLDIPAETKVPKLEGYTIDTAMQKLKDVNLTGRISRTVINDMYDKGIVLSQEPKEESKVREGTSVDLVVAGGAKKIKVPYVIGKNYKTAEKILNAKGIEIIDTVRQADSTKKDTVFDQQPVADTLVREGSRVKIYISRGKQEEEVAVPNLIGCTKEIAKKKIKAAKLKVEDVVLDYSSKPENIVFDQSLESGQYVKAGTSISIYVSNGENPEQSTQTPSVPNTNTSTNTNGNSTGNSSSNNSQTQNPTTTTVEKVKQTINYTLPTDSQSDSLNVRIEKVNADGTTEEIYNNVVDPTTQPSVSVGVEGQKGTTSNYEVYIDDEAKDTIPVNFK